MLVARNAQLLAPCLHTLPKAHFGLKEDVFALRNRHLDLLVNAPSRGFLSTRSAVIRAVRCALEGHDFMEMHTPVLQSVASGASARPFETHHAAYDSKVRARATYNNGQVTICADVPPHQPRAVRPTQICNLLLLSFFLAATLNVLLLADSIAYTTWDQVMFSSGGGSIICVTIFTLYVFQCFAMRA